jgi:hypothetical protein
LNGIIELIRRRTRARRERRQLLKATGQLPSGWFSRLVYKVKAWNHERLARHRLQKQLLASLAANDTAVLEALVFLLDASRREQRTRSEAEEGLTKRLAALEERVDLGVTRLEARLQGMEGRLVAAARGNDAPEAGLSGIPARPAPSSGVNGELKHPLGSPGRVAEHAGPSEGERLKLAEGKGRRA